jgi:hypothetical protein
MKDKKPIEIESSTCGVILSTATKEYSNDKFVQNFRFRTSEEYPQELEFTLYNKGIEKFKEYIKEGAVASIRFNIKSREYNERIYFSLVPWFIEIVEGNDDEAFEEEESQTEETDSGLVDDTEDDVPF